MSDPTDEQPPAPMDPKPLLGLDPNDVLIATGRRPDITGTEIDPWDPRLTSPGTVVSMIDHKSKRASGRARARNGGPPPDDTPWPTDGDGPNGGGRPKIVVTAEEEAVNDAAELALAARPNLYARGNALVRVLSDDTRRPVIVAVPPEVLQEQLSSAARFVRLKQDDEVHVHPPKWCVGNILGRGNWKHIPALAGVTETPILRADGTIHGKPGYDRVSGFFYAPIFKPELPPDQPTVDDVKAAVAELDDVVCDFEFAQPSHRSAWFAAVLSPIARLMFSGPPPLFLFDAPVAGTGKGLAVDVAIHIATGRRPNFSVYTTKDDEMGKRIVGWAAEGERTVVLDEVTGQLDGAHLRSALTSSRVSGRWLGGNRNWSGPNDIMWYATGNNVAAGPEFIRRVAHVRLESPIEDPSQRSGFGLRRRATAGAASCGPHHPSGLHRCRTSRTEDEGLGVLRGVVRHRAQRDRVGGHGRPKRRHG